MPQSRSQTYLEKGELQVALGALWQKLSFVHIIYARLPGARGGGGMDEMGGQGSPQYKWLLSRLLLLFYLYWLWAWLLHFLIYVAAVAPA